MTEMLTWRSPDGAVLEATRVLLYPGGGLRGLGRLVSTAGPEPYTASYRLVVADDGTVSRLSITSAAAERERHLTINHTEDGYWLLDTSSGGARSEFEGAVDVDVPTSPFFATLPVRRLGLHAEAGDHELRVVSVTLPELAVELRSVRYRTVAALGGGPTATVARASDGQEVELVVDGDGYVVEQPGVGRRVRPEPVGG